MPVNRISNNFKSIEDLNNHVLSFSLVRKNITIPNIIIPIKMVCGEGSNCINDCLFNKFTINNNNRQNRNVKV